MNPYLSFILALRADGYPSPQAARVRLFVDSLVEQLGDGSDDLYELVVVDWNPPSASQTALSTFDFSPIANLVYRSIPHAMHLRCPESADREMLDYRGRNVGIQIARGTFVCVTNQDILLSPELASAIRLRSFDARAFYRSDRVDIDCNWSRVGAMASIKHWASPVRLHRRHSLDYGAISVDVSDWSAAPDLASRPAQGDSVAGCLIFSSLRAGGADLAESRADGSSPTFHDIAPRVGLHTNAAGDFIIAARQAFEVIGGFPEVGFYMHTDSYAVVQLWAAGYRQALFRYPAAIYHVEHERPEREGHEGVTWREHNEALGRVLAGTSPYDLNGDDGWGLRSSWLTGP